MALELSTVSDTLMEYGLSRKEAEVYVYVASCGPCKASEIVGALSMPRTEVYRVLTDLQHMGVLEATLQRPAKFAAVQVSQALETLIGIQKRRASILESKKPELLEKWKALEITPTKEVKERFQVLEGLGTLYSKALEIAKKTEKEVCFIGSEKDVARAYHEDVIDHLVELKKKKMKVRLLTEVSERTEEILKEMDIQVKCTDVITPMFPHFIIADSSELLLFIKSSRPSGKESALWTNSETLLQTMRGLFEELWKAARPFHEAVYETRSKKGAVIVPRIDEEAALSTRQFKEQMRSIASVLGLVVEEDYEVLGGSGVSHVFDLAVTVKGLKPILIDLDLSDSPLSMVSVISFFAKKLDVRDHASNLIFVVRNVDQAAVDLSGLYGLRIAQFNGSRIVPLEGKELLVTG